MSDNKIKYGIVYVLAHPVRRAVKVGYTSPGAGRVEGFMRDGWQLQYRLYVATPAMARDIEQATLFELRHRLHIQPFLTSDRMNTGGWTETASVSLLTPRHLWEIVCEQAGLLQMSPLVSAPDRRRWNGGVPPRRRPGDTPRYSRIARTQARLERTADTQRTTPREDS